MLSPKSQIFMFDIFYVQKLFLMSKDIFLCIKLYKSYFNMIFEL